MLLILLIVGFILFSNSTYTVTIDGNGANITTSSKEVKKGTTIKDIEVPTREGYKFLYWMIDGTPCKESDEITKDVKLVAVWESEKPKYVVKFNTDGGSAVVEQKVEEGTALIKPTDPTKEGYKFLYWQLDGKEYDFSSQITKDIILTAKWEKVEEKEEDKDEEETTKKYTVTFKDGTKTLKTVSVKEGSSVSKITTPTKSGYKFVKWQLDGKDYNFGSKVTKDITLTAVWEKVVTYTVKFHTDGGSKVTSKIVEQNKTVAKPTTPTKTGYKFIKWQLNGKDYNFSSKVTKDITLKAVWEKVVKYTVKFDTDGGSSISSKTVEQNKTVAKPTTPTKTGYKFIKWQLDGKDYDFSSKVTKDITLKAIYREEAKYTVTFKDGNKVVTTKTVVEGNKVAKPTNPTKAGYDFGGWLLDGKAYDFGKTVTKNITLTSKWTQKTYTVTVTLVDHESNPARKLVVKQGSTVISDAKAIKTTDGIVVDNSAPFTINATSVSKLGSSVIVVLKDGTEVKATIVK